PEHRPHVVTVLVHPPSPCGERLSAVRPAIALASPRPALNSYCLRTLRPAQRRLGLSSELLLRNHDGHLLCCRPAPAIRPDNRNRMLTRSKLIGEVPEIPIGCDVRHGLSIDNQSCTWFRPAHDLCRLSDNLRAGNFQDHVLCLALRHERELENCADFAGLLLSIRCSDAPKIVARIQARDVYACALGRSLFYRLGEHCSGADSQRRGCRIRDGRPRKMK